MLAPDVKFVVNNDRPPHEFSGVVLEVATFVNITKTKSVHPTSGRIGKRPLCIQSTAASDIFSAPVKMGSCRLESLNAVGVRKDYTTVSFGMFTGSPHICPKTVKKS
jgi:hypothetical protein